MYYGHSTCTTAIVRALLNNLLLVDSIGKRLWIDLQKKYLVSAAQLSDLVCFPLKASQVNEDRDGRSV